MDAKRWYYAVRNDHIEDLSAIEIMDMLEFDRAMVEDSRDPRYIVLSKSQDEDMPKEGRWGGFGAKVFGPEDDVHALRRSLNK